jgi:hypothetical protein
MSSTSNTSNTNNSYKDRVSIESLHIVSICSLAEGKNTNDECALCKRDLYGPSSTDLQKGNFKVVVAAGVCGHAFHKTCIDAHYAKDNYSCPVDMTPWNLSKLCSSFE